MYNYVFSMVMKNNLNNIVLDCISYLRNDWDDLDILWNYYVFRLYFVFKIF